MECTAGTPAQGASSELGAAAMSNLFRRHIERLEHLVGKLWSRHEEVAVRLLGLEIGIVLGIVIRMFKAH